MAQAVLDFALDLERLAELTVMLLIGALLTRRAFTTTSLSRRAVADLRRAPDRDLPDDVGTPLTRTQRRLAAWFGIRGIGSVYYLAYALTHGATTTRRRVVTDAVLVTIVVSVLLHGSSATPIMELYRNARGAAGRRRS